MNTLKNNMNSPFRLDEGYSEETRSQSEGDTMRVDPASLELEERAESQLELPDWVKNLNEVQRSGM
jgi:F-box and WD-40 domain protein 1/11